MIYLLHKIITVVVLAQKISLNTQKCLLKNNNIMLRKVIMMHTTNLTNSIFIQVWRSIEKVQTPRCWLNT